VDERACDVKDHKAAHPNEEEQNRENQKRSTPHVMVSRGERAAIVSLRAGETFDCAGRGLPGRASAALREAGEKRGGAIVTSQSWNCCIFSPRGDLIEANRN